MPSVYLLLTIVSMLLLSDGAALAQARQVLTFSTQDGWLPKSIEVRRPGGGTAKSLNNFSAKNKQLTLTAGDFSAPLETFTVTVQYSAETKLEFALRMMMPLVDREAEIFLVGPRNYPAFEATKAQIRLLSHPSKSKAYEPYFVCRQAYSSAEPTDRKTQVNAALCWLTANAWLVFADPAGEPLRLYSPDAGAIAEVEKILSKPEDPNIDDDERAKWHEALEARAPLFRNLRTVKDDILRLKLALWHFFPQREELRKVHGRTRYCEFMAMLRESASALTDEQRQRLTQLPFAIKPADIDALQAEVRLASTGQACI